MTTVLAALLLALATPLANPDPHRDPDLPGNIRSTAPWVRPLLCTSAARSTTLGQLVAAVRTAPLMVYVVEARGEPAGWDGRIRFIGRAGRWRYVQIDVRRQAFDAESAALLAHELQHALEVHRASVDDRVGFDELFARIGFPPRERVPQVVDTVAAIRAGVDTFRELTGRAARFSPTMARALLANAQQ